MATQNNKVYYILSFIVLLILGFFFYQFLNSKKKIEWKETYGESQSDYQYRPYDLTLLHDCLTGADFKTKDVKDKLKRVLADPAQQNTSYIFIGEAMNTDTADIDALFEYIKRGNDAFISSKYLSKKFLSKILKNQEEVIEETQENIEEVEEIATDEAQTENLDNIDEEEAEKINNNEALPPVVVEENQDQEESLIMPEDKSFTSERAIADSIFNWQIDQQNFFEDDGMNSITDSIITVSLSSPDSFVYKTGYFSYFEKNKNPIVWHYFDEDNFPPSSFMYPTTVFSKISGRKNGMAINIGNGTLFLHSNPILFTNIELENENAKNYCMKTFSMLRKGDLLWDNGNRTTKWAAQLLENKSGSDRANNDMVQTPLKYILSTPAFAWAWKALLTMGVIFMIFSTKRRQRIIPILAKNVNTSLQFIKNIGRLYFNEGNHQALSDKQFKQWQWFVRERYGLVTSNLSEVSFQERLAQKSNIPLTQIKNLIEEGNEVTSHYSQVDKSIQLHKILEQFYKNCK